MENRRVYTTAIVSSEELKKAIHLQATCIVCNEIELHVRIPAHIEIINADRYRVSGSHEAYAYNSKIIEAFCRKYHRFLYQGEFNIQPCLRKLTYWTNYKTGYLQSALRALPPEYTRLNEVAYLPGSRWKSIFKYLKYFASNNYLSLIRKKQCPLSNEQADLGILVNNDFELKLFQEVISKLKHSKTIVFHYGNIQKDDTEATGNLRFIDLSKTLNYTAQKFVNPFLLTTEEIQILNIISSAWQSIAHELARYRLIKQTGIKKLLLNVAENLPLRNLMPEVFREDIRVYNTMNGMKAGEAQDTDITFDKWFVWDQEMKAMMHRENGLAEEKLIVSGHLSKDFLQGYTFKNTIGINTEQLKDKRVISVFSVKGLREEKQEAFEVLYKFLEQHKDFHLLIKPHPLESQNDYIKHKNTEQQVTWINETYKNSKEAVYDVLYLSDVSLVFGSTVSLESTWMGVPCLSFEKRDQSLIYNLKNSDIKHIRSKGELKEALGLIKKKTKIETQETKTASELIAAELIN